MEASVYGFFLVFACKDGEKQCAVLVDCHFVFAIGIGGAEDSVIGRIEDDNSFQRFVRTLTHNFASDINIVWESGERNRQGYQAYKKRYWVQFHDECVQ